MISFNQKRANHEKPLVAEQTNLDWIMDQLVVTSCDTVLSKF